MRDLFTTLVKTGTDDGQSAAFTPSRLAFLEQLIETRSSHAVGENGLEQEVQAYLVKSHPSLKSQLEAAVSTTSLLLHSHASFPFTEEAPITKDALIRSIGLLTQSSDYMFSQSADVGRQPAIRTRSKTARMDFLFSALARPESPTGVPTKDDVLDILCRIRYPVPSSPSFSQRRPIADLEPLAERLLPSSASLPSRDDLRVSIASLRPLADICNAMRNDNGAEGEELLIGKESLGRQEFKQWAKAVSDFHDF